MDPDQENAWAEWWSAPEEARTMTFQLTYPIAGAGRSVGRRMVAAVAEPERRSWLSHGLAGLVVASIGLAGVASISLLPSQTLAAQGSAVSAPPLTSTGTPLSAFDSTARALRVDAPPSAFVRTGQLMRSYQLATAQQQTAELAGSLRAGQRRAALAAGALTIDQAEDKLVNGEQQREIQQQVATDMATKAAQYKAEAEAEFAAAQQQQAAATMTGNNTGAFVPALPTESAATSTTDTARTSTSVPGTGRVVSPISSATIGAYFGETGSLWARYHTGLDFHAAMGEPVHAAADGVVVLVAPVGTGSDTWAGNHIAIQHADGLTTMYCHLSVIDVKVGQRVAANTVIGLVGATGHVTGPHLHFELYPAGVQPGNVYQAIDPQAWLASHGVSIRRT